VRRESVHERRQGLAFLSRRHTSLEDFISQVLVTINWIFYGGRPMRLTSKGRYAVRAMLDLTTHSNGNPVRLQEISTRQNISLHYLEQLFRKLRNGQAVKSVRGPGGGYVLARNQDQITIKDVLDCVGENINPARDIVGTEAEASNSLEFHLSKNYFMNLGIIMKEYLATTSLGDLVRKSKETETEAGISAANEQSGIMTSAIRNPVGEINQ
jgi:Rrf2 family iron-sulfur cluster assembly transcriptional regulator